MRMLISVVVVAWGSSRSAIADPKSCDAPALHRAAKVALTAAKTAGVADDALASCATTEPTCGDPADSVDPKHCRIAVAVRNDRYEVTVRPAAIDGAPRSYSAWLALDTFAVGNTELAGERWGVVGALAVIGVPGYAIHTHGGDAAAIGRGSFHLYNRGTTAAHVTLRSAAWLHDSQCNVPGDPVALQTATLAPAIAPARGDIEIAVEFPAQHAYQSWCDRFGVAVELDVDGKTLRTATEIHVSRVDPIRPSP
jgi:hypothetical protein